MLRSARRGHVQGGGLTENKENAVEPPRARSAVSSLLGPKQANAGPSAARVSSAKLVKPKKLTQRDYEKFPASQRAVAETAADKRTPLASTPEPHPQKAALPTEGNRTGVLSVKQVNIQRHQAETHPSSVFNANKARPSRQAFVADNGEVKKSKPDKLVPVDLRKALASVATGACVERDGHAYRKKVAFSEFDESNSKSDAAKASLEGEVKSKRDQVAERFKVLEPQIFAHTDEEVEYQPPRAKELPWDPGFEVDFTSLFLKPPDSDLYYVPRPSAADLNGPGTFAMEEVRKTSLGRLRLGTGRSSKKGGYDDTDDLLVIPVLDDIDAAAAQIRKEDYIFFDPLEV